MADIYQHFQSSEKEFIDRVYDWISQVEDKQYLYCSYFLNPREAEIAENLANSRSLKFFSAPQGDEAEYRQVIIAPDYYSLDMADFDLTLLEVDYPSKFRQIKHGQVLGTLLGETGLSRREIGDILVNDDKIQVYVSKRLADHFRLTIKKIAGLPVELKEVPLKQAIKIADTSQNTIILVSSMRLDKIIASSLKISRNLAVNVIQSGVVKVNYIESIKNEQQLKVGDLISVKGHGRIKILQQLGLTKKDKQKVEVSVILNHKK